LLFLSKRQFELILEQTNHKIGNTCLFKGISQNQSANVSEATKYMVYLDNSENGHHRVKLSGTQLVSVAKCAEMSLNQVQSR